ncbi:L-gulonolactone oxidase 3 [Silene latifolia]|uniref:L-gulonolactone oxidase 3 n=1 Tax=Silene latifolia TaxID=37657 RepID=UPI003D76FAB3
MRNLLMAFLIFGIILLILPLNMVAKPPPNTVECDMTSCTLNNGYGVWGDRRTCTSPTISYPTTEEELLSAVADANQNHLKVKVVTKYSHTIPKLACPSTQSNNTMLISTELYNSGIQIDAKNMLVTVDAGVGLRDLINKVEGAGLSLVAAPYWEGVSVGGMISTGAHGSSWWGKGGAVHDHVVALTLVVVGDESQGYAKILKLEGNDPLFKAAKLSLGLLGVISKVTISLEPAFKRSITYNFSKDQDIENEYMKHGNKYEFGDIVWYPSKHTAVYRYDNRVPFNTSGDGVYDFLGFQSQSILVSSATRSFEKTYESTRDTNGKCIMASTFIGYKKFVANGLKNNKLIFTNYPVIGTQAKMQTSASCLYSSPLRLDLTCAWDPSIKGLFFYETTAIFPASKFGDFVRDVKKLRDVTSPQKLCGIDIYNGILVRFIKASNAYLGQIEDSVVIDFNYFRADDPKLPRLNQDVLEEIEQMAFIKYGARPHWAKNRNLAFEGISKKFPNWSKFVEVKKKLDPKGMFSSEWSDEILFGNVEENGVGCALEGLCVCSEDRHCNPSKGYFCEQGLVYLEARVCRYSPSKISNFDIQ